MKRLSTKEWIEELPNPYNKIIIKTGNLTTSILSFTLQYTNFINTDLRNMIFNHEIQCENEL